MPSYLEVLKNEFEAQDGSFLIQLRPWLKWDKDSFLRLVKAMRAYCEAEAGTEDVKRWIVQGFWYIPWFVKSWTSHPNFPKVHTEEYYQAAFELLDMLAYYAFFGFSPFETPAGFDELFERISR